MEEQVFGKKFPFRIKADVVRPEKGQGIEPFPDRHPDLHIVRAVGAGADHPQKQFIDLWPGVDAAMIVFGSRSDGSAGGNIIVTAEADVGVGLGQPPGKQLQHPGVKIVVWVCERGKVSMRMGKAGVPRGTEPSIFLMDDPDTGILPGVGVALLGRAIGGTVVNEQDVKVLMCLAQQRVHAAVKIGQNVVDGNNNTDAGHSKVPFPGKYL